MAHAPKAPPAPALTDPAQQALAQGRAAAAKGDLPSARAAFAAGFAADGRMALHDWGLVPHLVRMGQGSFQDRLQDRLHAWRQRPLPDHLAPVIPLGRKVDLRPWATAQGFAMPALVAQAPRLADLNWADLPADCVIKPQNAAASLGVIVAAGGVDRMTGAPLTGGLQAVATRSWATAGLQDTPVLVEELVRDIDQPRDPALVIPRDFKVFCVAGQVGFIRVHDRNAPGGWRGLATFDAHGTRLPTSHKGWPQSPQAPLPQGWDALITAARRISALVPFLLRFDFYLSDRGPLLGEVTTYPNAGLDFPPFYQRTLLQMWELWPDDGSALP